MTDSTWLFIECCWIAWLVVVSDCIVLAGAAFTVWARITLGRNWSAEVTFKQDHELIESGPYAEYKKRVRAIVPFVL